MHFTILQANLVGAPRGKALAAKASASNNPPNVDNSTSAPASSGISTGNTNTAVALHPDPFSTPDILPTGTFCTFGYLVYSYRIYFDTYVVFNH